MAGSVNRVTLIGRVGKDPEVRSFQNGGKIASFSVATSERWKNKAGEPQEKTEWHNVCVKNDHLVKIVEQYVKKGSLIYIEGKIETRKYEKDGVERYITETVVPAFGGVIQLLDSKEGGGKSETAPSEPKKAAGARDDFDDSEIPF